MFDSVLRHSINRDILKKKINCSITKTTAEIDNKYSLILWKNTERETNRETTNGKTRKRQTTKRKTGK